MARYGCKNCNHYWVLRTDGYEEYCVAVVCNKCGAFGCYHDFEGDYIREHGYVGFIGFLEYESMRITFDSREGVKGDANINGRWINPYVKKSGTD